MAEEVLEGSQAGDCRGRVSERLAQPGYFVVADNPLLPQEGGEPPEHEPHDRHASIGDERRPRRRCQLEVGVGPARPVAGRRWELERGRERPVRLYRDCRRSRPSSRPRKGDGAGASPPAGAGGGDGGGSAGGILATAGGASFGLVRAPQSRRTKPPVTGSRGVLAAAALPSSTRFALLALEVGIVSPGLWIRPGGPCLTTLACNATGPIPAGPAASVAAPAGRVGPAVLGRPARPRRGERRAAGHASVTKTPPADLERVARGLERGSERGPARGAPADTEVAAVAGVAGPATSQAAGQAIAVRPVAEPPALAGAARAALRDPDRQFRSPGGSQ